MKKTRLSLLLLSSSLLLAACGGSQGSSSSSDYASSSDSEPSSSNPASSPEIPLEDERQIIIEDLPDIGLGETIDLNDYVTIVRGIDEDEDADLYWDYDILYDNVHKETAAILDPTRPTIGQSTVLQAVRTGRVNLRINSGDVSKTAYFDVTTNAEMTKVVDFFEAAEESNFTISLNENPIVYRNPNYIYFPQEFWGIVLNEKQAKGFYFQMNSVTDGASLRIGNQGNYAGDTELTPITFNNDFPNLATMFNPAYFEYSQDIVDNFGEEYAIAMIYDSSIAASFTNAQNLLGLSTYTIYSSNYYYPTAFVPKIDEAGTLSLYVLYSRQRGTIANTSLLAGPFIFSNVGTTSVEALDDYVASNGSTTLANADLVNDKLFAITNFTSHAVGRYEDLDGNKIDTPSYFATALPELDITVKVTENGYQNSRMDYVDGGEDTNVLLLNQMVGTSSTTYKYVLNDQGKYTSAGEYGNDPSSGNKVTDWTISSTFSIYKANLAFTENTWKYATYTVEDEENCYSLMGINDQLARSMMNMLIRGTTSEKFTDSGTPIYYYGFYAYMYMNIGSTAKDDMKFDYYTRVIDGDGEYYVYHLTIDMTAINSTVLNIPEAA